MVTFVGSTTISDLTATWQEKKHLSSLAGLDDMISWQASSAHVYGQLRPRQFRVEGLGFGAQGLGLRVQRLGFRAVRVAGSGLRETKLDEGVELTNGQHLGMDNKNHAKSHEL